MRRLGWTLMAGLAFAPAAPTLGQTLGHSDEAIRSRRLAEHNQLGILEYCRGIGAIGEDIVALQRAAIARLPGEDMAGSAETEALGRRGIVAFGASEVPVAHAAMGEGMSVRNRCKQMAMTVQAQAGQTPTW